MANIRNKIERWFESFSYFLCRFRWLTLLVVLCLVGGLAGQLPKITFDTSNESFLRATDPTLLTYNAFRSQFGRDDFIIVAIESDDIFNQGFLRKLKAFHEQLEENVPYIEDITSMVNARNTRGEGDMLIVEDLLENWPENAADLKALRDRVLSNPLYINRLVSEDGRFTTLVIQTDTYSSKGIDTEALAGFEEEEEEAAYLTDEELREASAKVGEIVAQYQAPDFKLYIAGAPMVSAAIKWFMIRDQKLFMRLIVLTIGLCLFLMFRRITAVILPLIVVFCALISTLGLMAVFNIPLKLPTSILPSFLMAVGVADSIHILTIFYRHLSETGRKNDAIAVAMGHSGLAIVLTTLTTAAGLASFSTSKVAPIAELGVFACIGVLLALLYTLILLPALLAVVPMKSKKQKETRSDLSHRDRCLIWVGNVSTRYATPITVICVLLIILSGIGASRLKFTHHVLTWLPETAQVKKATQRIDGSLKGSVVMEVIVDTGRINGLYDIDTLNKLERLARDIENIKQEDLFVGKATSVVDILKEIHKALNENRPEYYTLPQDPALIPQELLLFENSGSDDLEDVVDSQFQKARFTIKVPWLDAVKYVTLMADIAERFDRAFGKSATVTTTGMITILFSTMVSAIYSAAQSYIIAGVVITFMVMLLIGSIRIGLLAMLPNTLAILFVMGMMTVIHFPFNLFTMLIGSIAIGLAVDNTIHFMHNFRRYFTQTSDVALAVRETLLTTGQALFVTTVVLSIGFFIYMFASMKNLYHFGLLTGITIILALVSNFFLTPALMVLIHRPKKIQNKNGGRS